MKSWGHTTLQRPTTRWITSMESPPTPPGSSSDWVTEKPRPLQLWGTLGSAHITVFVSTDQNPDATQPHASACGVERAAVRSNARRIRKWLQEKHLSIFSSSVLILLPDCCLSSKWQCLGWRRTLINHVFSSVTSCFQTDNVFKTLTQRWCLDGGNSRIKWKRQRKRNGAESPKSAAS